MYKLYLQLVWQSIGISLQCPAGNTTKQIVSVTLVFGVTGFKTPVEIPVSLFLRFICPFFFIPCAEQMED
jgi:hypothetical protein